MATSALSLGQCLAVAETHWGHNRSMVSQARKCVGLLGASTVATRLGPTDAVKLLSELAKGGLARKSVACAYGIFRTMLKLNGVSTVGWPNAPSPPRKTREPMKGDDLDNLIGWLDTAGYGSTADLGRLLRGTGLRVSVEGLSQTALKYVEGPEYGTLHVTGKGGHERLIPVVAGDTRDLLGDQRRMDALRGVPYWTHLRRWKAGVGACGIASKLPTPHSVRHYYACEALALSGGNLIMAMQLMGHTDPKTTAQYLHVDMDAKAVALKGGSNVA